MSSGVVVSSVLMVEFLFVQTERAPDCMVMQGSLDLPYFPIGPSRLF